MARKSRKRRRRPAPPPAGTQARSDGEAAVRSPASPRPPRGRVADERPPAPWGSFPLVELVVLIGLVMLVAGFAVQGERGVALIGAGLALGSLAGLELSIREHFAGYRSHTLLLAGFAALVVLAALFYAGPESLPPPARVAIAAAVLGASAWLLTRAFRRRAGVAFRVRPPARR